MIQYHCLPTYNIAGLVRFTGKLDVPALAAAVTALAARHETLRTRLVADADGRPVQLIDPPAGVELPCLDLSDEPDPHAVPADPRAPWWRYRGSFLLTQYWRKPKGTWREALRLRVNGRRVYRPVTGGTRLRAVRCRNGEIKTVAKH